MKARYVAIVRLRDQTTEKLVGTDKIGEIEIPIYESIYGRSWSKGFQQDIADSAESDEFLADFTGKARGFAVSAACSIFYYLLVRHNEAYLNRKYSEEEIQNMVGDLLNDKEGVISDSRQGRFQESP